MIIRIAGEGQFDVAAEFLTELNQLDGDLTAVLEAGDEAAYGAALQRLAARVREVGLVVGTDHLVPSDVIIPPADSDLVEVQALLGSDGLIPG